MKKIIDCGLKIDFHIHSYASKHKDTDGKVDESTIDNIDVLIKNLNYREINMCAISDHDNFDFEIYKRLKQEENKGSIKKVFPAVEFSVKYDRKILHIVTIFNDEDEEKVKGIQSKIFNTEKNKPLYNERESFSEDKYLSILRDIGLDVVMIAHQKNSPSSKEARNHDVKSLGDKKFDELVFLDYFESFEFKNKKNEIFNKGYYNKNKDKYKDVTLRFITGTDCHTWANYLEDSDDAYPFTYLKCLPTFRGLAMAITNVKRINYVNNFYSTTDKYLKNIKIEINGKKYDIKLSKGINVIIGDNSIGKSLLIHKLTNYAYLNNENLKRSYEEYLKEMNIKISSTIPQGYIFKLDGQGAVRKMFETKNFDSFLNSFFPTAPLINSYLETYKREIDRYISILKNKEELDKSRGKLGSFTICFMEAQSSSPNFKKILQSNITTLNSKIKEIGKIVEYFKSINNLLKNILDNKFLESSDKEYINNTKEKNLELIEKYNNKIKLLEFKIFKMNMINTNFSNKMRELSQIESNESEEINNYENNKELFINNLVDYYFKSKKEIIYSPNLSKEVLPIKTREIGRYRFVMKSNIKDFSNENLNSLIKSVLGKSVKDINKIDSKSIPDKFSNRIKETTYYEKLDHLQKELNNVIEEAFKPIQSITDIKNKDATSELSSGFNSRMYFDLISCQSDDNRIYIVDQPEDDVSQPAIKNNLLEDFYEMSKHRQIIMITHNPQFIVNLDVDNVIFIGKNEKDEIYIQNGALEYNEEYDILKIVADNIEGGIESINERWKRYEKNLYNV